MTDTDPVVTYGQAKNAARHVLAAFDVWPLETRAVLADGLAEDTHPILAALGDALRAPKVLGPLLFARTLRRAGRSEVEQLAASLDGVEPWASVGRALIGAGRG